jgi:DNA-binding GntR family transcriptional regulator
MNATASALPRPKRKPIRSEVLDSIRDDIMSGRFQPGDLLREMTLAQDLGVSQNTIREALLQLERVGLVVRTPNKHTMVTRLTDAELIERVDLRILLEPVLCAEASQRMTGEDFAEIEDRLRDLTAAIARNAAIECAQADFDFHKTIWQKSGNPWLCRLLEVTTLPLFAFVSIVRYRRVDDLLHVVNPHEAIVQALRSRDPQRVADTVRKHYENSYGEFLPPGRKFLKPL